MATEEILSPTLTDEETLKYQAKADELAVKLSVSKVRVVVQIDPDTFKRHVCYLREPNYLHQVRIMDKAAQLGPFSAADEARSILTIKEESDAITYGDGPECSKYKLGVVDECLKMVERINNQFKKK